MVNWQRYWQVMAATTTETAAAVPATLEKLDALHSKNRVRFEHDGLHGYRQNGFVVWYRREDAGGCYVRCGSTNHPRGHAVKI
jgi:hypothetical protein